MSENEFITNVNELGISINNDILSKLNKYYEILINWNNKINLTRITDKKDVYLKHFYDSLTLIKAIDLNKELYVCDIGTGAGFPGLVLKIVFPNLKITLVDALNKRVDFLKEVIKELNEPKGEFVIVVSGNDEEVSYDDLSVQDHVDMYVRDGYTLKDAIKKVAKDRNVAKNEIYREVKLFPGK